MTYRAFGIWQVSLTICQFEMNIPGVRECGLTYWGRCSKGRIRLRTWFMEWEPQDSFGCGREGLLGRAADHISKLQEKHS